MSFNSENCFQKNKYFKFLKRKIIIFPVFLFLGLSFLTIVYADWNGLPFVPGREDNPPCLPSQINCDVIPSLTSEVDPIFIASQAFTITGLDIANWNGKQTALGFTPVSNQTMVNGYSLTSDIFITPSDLGLGNVTNESKATMFASPILTGTISVNGNINMSGSIIPTINDTYALGSPSKVWKDLYVGAGSIYVNGQKVLQTDPSNSVLVSADVSQNLILQTTGGGNVELNPASGGGQVLLKSNIVLTAGKTIRSSDLSSVIFSDGTTSGNIQTAGNIISSANLNGGISIAPNGLGNTYVTNGNFGVGTTSGLSKVSINGGLHVGGDSDAGDNNILADGTITGSNLSGVNTGDNAANSQYSGLITSKQDTLNGNGLVKVSGGIVSYDNNNYVLGTPWTSMNYVTGTPWVSEGYVTGTPWTSAGYITDGNTNWDNSYGFITGYTETDPTFSASSAAGITGTNISNWNTTYSWGNHTTAGYLTSANIGGLVPYTGGTSDIDLGNYNLTVDTNSLFVDSVNHRVSMGKTNPAYKLDVGGTAVTDAISTDIGLNLNPVLRPVSFTGATAGNGPGNVNAGDHYYYVSYVTALGETELSTAIGGNTFGGSQGLLVTTTPGDGQVKINVTTSSDSRVTGIKIYRTPADGVFYGTLRIVATISNTTQTYLDNNTDASLTLSSNYGRENTTNKNISVNGTMAMLLGGSSTGLGRGALTSLSSGGSNVAIGASAGNSISSGSSNVLIGYGVGAAGANPTASVAIGQWSLYRSTGSYNVAIGHDVLFNNVSGGSNTSIGYTSGFNNTGSNNLFLGASSGYAGTSTNNGVYLGNFSGKYETVSNKLFIDGLDRINEATGRINSLIYGVFNSTPANQILALGGGGNVGIGTIGPGYKLDISDSNNYGSVRIAGASGGGFVLGSWNATTGGFWSNGLTPSSTNYSLLANSTGNTFLNAASGQMVYLINSNGTNPGQLLVNQYGVSVNNGLVGATSGNGLIVGSGNVGIGTASPTRKLDVNGIISASNESFTSGDGAFVANGANPSIIQNLVRTGGGYGYSLFQGYAKNTTTGLSSLSVDYGVFGSLQSGSTSPTVQYAYFGVGPTAAYNNPVMVLQPNGNVGIGTTSPGQKLSIQSGALRFDYVATPPAPSGVLSGSGAGLLNNGTYSYKVVFVNSLGSSIASAASGNITVLDYTSNGKINITVPVSTDQTVTSRILYRTKVNGSVYYIQSTIADNATTLVSDNTPDASMTIAINAGYSAVGLTSGKIFAGLNLAMTVNSSGGVGFGVDTTGGSGSATFAGNLNIVDGGTSLSRVNNKLRIYNVGGSTLSYYNGSTIIDSLTADGMGNIGIGTTAPTANFQVSQVTSGIGTVATSGTTALIGTGTQFTNTFKVGDTITVTGETAKTITTITDDTHLTSTIAFSTSTSGLTYNLIGGTRLSVLGNGNVGIGTINPVAKLDVSGSIVVDYLQSLGSRNSINNVVPLISLGAGTMSGHSQSNLYRAGYINTNGWEIGDRYYVGMYGISNDGGGVINQFGIYTANTQRLTINQNGNVGIGTTSPSTRFEIGSSDLGDGQAGPILTLGRNTNATNSGAGSINFFGKDGIAGYVWQDVGGNLRINTSAPTTANDTAGTIVGAQTSERSTKQDIKDYTDYGGALAMVTNAPLHTFRYIKEVNGYGSDSPLAKTRIGYIADEVDPAFMIGNVIDQVSVNGMLMASVKELNLKLEDIAMPVDIITNRTFAERFYDKLIAWFGNPNNGLEKICVKKADGTSFCVNGDQLEKAVNGLSTGNNALPVAPIAPAVIKPAPEPVVTEPAPAANPIVTDPTVAPVADPNIFPEPVVSPVAPVIPEPAVTTPTLINENTL